MRFLPVLVSTILLSSFYSLSASAQSCPAGNSGEVKIRCDLLVRSECGENGPRADVVKNCPKGCKKLGVSAAPKTACEWIGGGGGGMCVVKNPKATFVTCLPEKGTTTEVGGFQ